MPFNVEPIGIIHSCFREKFGIPRQPGLASAARAELELLGECASFDAVRGLEECSHLWILFLFSEHLDRGWTPLVRPPRSQGGKRGVFATRSTFRPNPIGQSAVRLLEIKDVAGKPRLILQGADILDGTPVIDIKPYLPYADSISDATYPYAADAPRLTLPVTYSPAAQAALLAYQQQIPELQALIEDVVLCDPRPVQHHKQSAEREYGVRLHDLNVRWRYRDEQVQINAIDTAQ